MRGDSETWRERERGGRGRERERKRETRVDGGGER